MCVMAQTTTVKLIDDLDGTNADETLVFALDGKSYELDLSKRNAAALRKVLQPYLDVARSGNGARRAPSRRPKAPARSTTRKTTLFSQLTGEEKDQFRVWAEMPMTRRIPEALVQQWLDADKP
jgi:hypothetical protein